MGIRVIAWGDIRDFPGEVCPDREHSSRQAAIDCGRALQRKAWCAQKWPDSTDSAGYMVVDMLGADSPRMSIPTAVEVAKGRFTDAATYGSLTEAMQGMARLAILRADAASDE